MARSLIIASSALAGSLLLYEYVIRRVDVLRGLFGMKPRIKHRTSSVAGAPAVALGA